MEPSKRLAAIATISALLGASGGSFVSSLDDTQILDTQSVIEFQDQNLKDRQSYKQILQGGIDADTKATIRNFPDNVHVDVYDGPLGRGYTIVQDLPTKTIHMSFGPEGAERTFIEEKPQPVATSTKQL